MRYILIAKKDDVASVLKIVYHNNSCQREIQKEKKKEKI
jgi:hypothetical protein